MTNLDVQEFDNNMQDNEHRSKILNNEDSTLNSSDKHIHSYKSRFSTTEKKCLEEMNNMLLKSSYKYAPIDSTTDKEISSTNWSREEIALFCLRSYGNDVEQACKSYKAFTTLRYIYNITKSFDLSVCNPIIVSQLKSGKITILDKLDLHGRVVIMINLHYKKHDISPVDQITALFLFITEIIMRENPFSKPAQSNGMILLVNSRKTRQWEFKLDICLRLSKILSNYFPIRLGQILIFRPHRIVKMVFKVIFLVHVNLRRKFQIINKLYESPGSITEFDALSHFIDKYYIPTEYGGYYEFDSHTFWSAKILEYNQTTVQYNLQDNNVETPTINILKAID
ncbi:CRAL/TRIO domain-containing protein [Cryptosporidium muris RN66]|uniref:CRAL/TRIO domain-containing protein n=1 Tax=Cryptosporidium muris (strain RN66) TaxID=441375 RepID=B6AHK8_CRYMR|nr:CRAL/TRIO domain-containing protein [Cryptosporidium muris RN66]EEA07703.1 CRAL/TRIO domain-containing protein [Cryptosporidium muris RN66]|eukprot:XP_002142052.1 CRAL/TRIO domain-containing protein [Cryptosporidium muris RN66]